MNQKIMKKEKTKKPYTLKVYQEYKKTERKYWKTLKFPNFKKFEEFVWKLFEKSYKIDKIRSEIMHIYAPKRPEIPTKWSINEIWICSKKEKKCYVFEEPITNQEKKLYWFLEVYFPLNKSLNKKEIANLYKKKEEERKEFNKKKGGLIKKRDMLMKEIEEKSKKERQMWLKELETIDKVIEKLPRKNSQEH